MKIKDVMTEAPACCTPDTTLDAVARLMLEHDCGEIPICDGTKIVGVITDRDIACRAFTQAKDPLQVTAGEIMTKHPYVVIENTDIDAALDLMARHQLRRLPVIRQGKVVGIVSQADLFDVLPAHKAVSLLQAISARPESLIPA
jgi:CBS domain-containing protein